MHHDMGTPMVVATPGDFGLLAYTGGYLFVQVRQADGQGWATAVFDGHNDREIEPEDRLLRIIIPRGDARPGLISFIGRIFTDIDHARRHLKPFKRIPRVETH